MNEARRQFRCEIVSCFRVGSALFPAKRVLPFTFELSSITEVCDTQPEIKRHTKVKVSPIYRCVAKSPEGRTKSVDSANKTQLASKYHLAPITDVSFLAQIN